MNDHRTVHWWQLYLALPLLVGLMIMARLAHLSEGSEELMQTAFVLTCVGLGVWWLKCNLAALMMEESDRLSNKTAQSEREL